jgi:hypothetical protein
MFQSYETQLKYDSSQAQWLMLGITATWEVEIGIITVAHRAKT